MRVRRPTSYRTRLIAGCVALCVMATAVILAVVYLLHARDAHMMLADSVHAELDDLSHVHTAAGHAGLVTEIQRRIEVRHETIYLLGDPASVPEIGSVPEWPPEVDTENRFSFAVKSGLRYEAEVRDLGPRARLLVAQDARSRDRHLDDLRDAIALGGTAVLAMVIGVALWVGFTLLGGVRDLERAARAIMKGDRSRRVPVSGQENEYDALAATFNRLLDENDRLLSDVRSVTDSIAHDLRTPLAHLRHRIESLLTAAPDPEKTTTELASALEELDGVLHTFESLLALSRLDSGVDAVAADPVDLGRLARDVVDLHGPAAEDEGLSVRCEAPPGIVVSGSRPLLFQMLSNLVDNSRKHARSGGEITVQVLRDGEVAVMEVCDRGPGIPAAEREQALARFGRLVEARNPAGSGIGLTLAHTIAKAHGANLSLADNAPGLKVIVRFAPATPADHDD